MLITLAKNPVNVGAKLIIAVAERKIFNVEKYDFIRRVKAFGNLPTASLVSEGAAAGICIFLAAIPTLVSISQFKNSVR